MIKGHVATSEAYQGDLLHQVDQLLAENKELKTRAAQLIFELNQLRARSFNQPVRLQEAANA